MRACLFVSPVICGLSSGESRPGVPSNAVSATRQIQTAVRTALASGKRRLCVDLLMAAVDVRTRVYDDEAAQAVFAGLVTSVQPVLPADGGELQVVVSGATTALRVRGWLDRSALDGVSVTVLGADANARMDSKGSPSAPLPSLSASLSSSATTTDTGKGKEEKSTAALLVLNPPPGSPDSMADLRKLLRTAHERGLPVVVQNHPRPDAVYNLLGYGGTVPIEMVGYEPVFVVAPFALKPAVQDSQPDPTKRQESPRFVLMRQYPAEWALWQFRADDVMHPELADVAPGALPAGGEYVLCTEFSYRPDDQAVVQAVAARISSLNL